MTLKPGDRVRVKDIYELDKCRDVVSDMTTYCGKEGVVLRLYRGDRVAIDADGDLWTWPIEALDLITPPQDGAEQAAQNEFTPEQREALFTEWQRLIWDYNLFDKFLQSVAAQSQTAALRARVSMVTADDEHLRAEIERLRGAIEWALGYTDFPARKEGDPPYYWRKKLRELSGIEQMPNIPHRSSPTQ